MKRVILLVGLALLCTVGLYAAAPDAHNEVHKLADQVIDSQYTASWEYIDSVIVIKTDTCYTLYTISGVAVLGPGDKLYVGLSDGGGDYTKAAADTIIVAGDISQRGTIRIPFSLTYQDSLVSQSDLNDTIYVTAAVGGSAASEKVTIENMFFEAKVIDADERTSS